MSKSRIVAMYIRLSNEDADISKSDTKFESNSVSNQRDLLMDFISHHEDLTECNILEFCDDGYSGTNFDRPAVQRLLSKVRQREIDCIVVKDFSRFGRSYLELGDYLEQVFPFLGVRFISVNDGYDSARDKGMTAGLDIGLKNLIYDLYSKDLSQKVKIAKKAKMKKGEYIGSFAPYGYLKSKNKKNTIVVDKEAAVIVKRIFKLVVQGNNISTIAKILNGEGVPSPARHFQNNHDNKKWRKAKGNLLWYSAAIIKILRDETYTGKTVNHKREIPNVNSRSTGAVPREEWIVVPNTHEAIICEELYMQTQKIIGQVKKRKERIFDTTRVVYGKVKCGICKKSLQRSHTKIIYYLCRSNYYDENCSCFKGRIKEQLIIEILLETIRKQAQIANKSEEFILKVKQKSENEILELLQSIRKAQQYIERLNALKIEEYEKYLDGNITKNDYLKRKEKYNGEIEETTFQINKLETEYELQKLKNKESENQFVEHFKNKHEIKELSRVLIDELVDSIYVYSENEIEVVWNFRDDYVRVIEAMQGSDEM